tara:strand:+ start:298 stop:720 length:423 start_codon:yes stop_codon:yes gene_type:complete
MSQVSIPIQFDWSAIARGTHYSPAAFSFVQEGLGYTAGLFADIDFDESGLGELGRHVSGRQLCMGLRDYAIEQFGLLAPVVLRNWGVFRTEDFGAIVFHMVELELLRTSPQDSEDDFRSVFQFDEVFHENELANCVGANQ